MIREAGIEENKIKNCLKNLGKKVYSIDGWVVLTNFLKYLPNSPKIVAGIVNELEHTPETLWQKIEKLASLHDTISIYFNRLSIPYPYGLNYSNSNSNSNLNSNSIKKLNKEIIEIIKMFADSINPVISYGHRTNRKAIEELIAILGFEKLKKIVEFAISVQGNKFSPVITNPYQLKEKLAQLMIYAKKESGKKIIGL